MSVSLSFWIVFVAGLMPYFVVAIAKATRAYDNRDPRNEENYAAPLRHRAHAAHNNCLEAFPFFAIGVVVATLLHANGTTVDMLATVWLSARLAYISSYLMDRAALRSLFWFVASFATIGIYLSGLLAL